MNERHCIVIFGDWMNRLEENEKGFYEVETIEVVQDLELIGPNGPVSAVGLTFTSPPGSTFTGSAPYILAAKMNPISAVGEGGSKSVTQVLAGRWYPNGGLTLYPTATHRLRLFNSGGMTPTGIGSVNPNSFSEYFKLRLSNDQMVTEANVPYTVGGTTVTVLGLADLGRPTASTDDPCYGEDRDNYIDIILAIDGDSSVVTQVDAFETKGLYNPGGPGEVNNGWPVTGESQPQTIDVMNDENNDMVVSWCGSADGATISMNADECQQALQAGRVKMMQVGSLATLGPALMAAQQAEEGETEGNTQPAGCAQECVQGFVQAGGCGPAMNGENPSAYFPQGCDPQSCSSQVQPACQQYMQQQEQQQQEQQQSAKPVCSLDSCVEPCWSPEGKKPRCRVGENSGCSDAKNRGQRTYPESLIACRTVAVMVAPVSQQPTSEADLVVYGFASIGLLFVGYGAYQHYFGDNKATYHTIRE